MSGLLPRPTPAALLGGVAALAGVWAAARRAWLCDDAFISLRYADHLARGDGLVFNVGERVEGFTNLSWTLLLAAAMRLGADGERVAVVAGLVCFAATLALLLGVSLRRGGALPLGALLLAASPAALDFATGGLETAAFGLLLVGGLVAAEGGRAPLAGLLLGLATLTRPDGALVAGVVTVGLALRDRRAALQLALAAAAVVGPATLARVAYYGELLPNTFYAKSGGSSWWSQGLLYLGLHLRQHPWLLLLPLALRAAPLPAVAALAYVAWVVKVGGDFMAGRLLAPATAMGALALDGWLRQLAARSPRGAWAAALLALPGLVVPGVQGVIDGVRDERVYYGAAVVDRMEADTATLRRFTDGLPLTVAIGGAQARMAWRAGWPVVIETATGLTDAWIARQPLPDRGRVGHEKKAPLEYVVLRRKADLTFSPEVERDLELDARIPRVEADLGGVWARLLRWTFPVADALKARGARISNYPALLAADAEALPGLSDAEAEAVYRRHWLFYFAHNDDPAREAAFRARLPGFDPTVEIP